MLGGRGQAQPSSIVIGLRPAAANIWMNWHRPTQPAAPVQGVDWLAHCIAGSFMIRRAPALPWLLTLGYVLSSCGTEPEPEPRRIDATSQAVQSAVHGNSRVAGELHRALRERPGNLFYSPLGIESVLGMLYAGAAADTANQLGALLGAEGDPASLHAGLGSLLVDLSGDHPSRGYDLSLANRLFGAPDMQPSSSFVAIMRDDYRAPLERIDFQQPEAARETINRWVADQTHARIPDLLEPGQITPRSLLALVNAVYFKARWAVEFDPSDTASAPFHRAGGTSVPVQMMRRSKTKLRVSQLGEASLVEIPYRGGDVSFLGLLPAEAQDLAEVEANLDLAALAPAELQRTETELEASLLLPRFELKCRFDLIPVLRALGVVDLFDEGLADLSPIDPRPGLFVWPFVHEAWLKVDEEGAEAAAATAAVALTRSVTPTFVFDRPFLFFIRDNLTGAILFTGRVSDPS
jgi:serpin B